MICEFYLNKTVIKIKNVKGICYGLDRKCPPKIFMFMSWLAADKLLGCDWIMRALISPVDQSTDGVTIWWH
jgi:hypothetical protein